MTSPVSLRGHHGSNSSTTEELLAAAGAGVNKSKSVQFFEDALVEIESCALDAFAVVLESEPGEVFVDAVDVFLSGATLVVVLDAQVNFHVPFFCRRPHVKGGKQMPFVEVARRARCKTDRATHK